MSDIKVAIDAIARAEAHELDAVIAAVKARDRALRELAKVNALTEFAVGDRVKLSGLSPKYLNGCRGEIRSIEGSKFVVRLDVNELVNGQARRRFGEELHLPANCVEREDSA